MRRNLFLFLLSLVFAGRASADGMDLVTQSGVWGTACPPVVCSQTGDIWSYSFETPATLSGYGGNAIVTSTVTDFEYYINGKLVTALTRAYNEAWWYPQDDDGGFALLDDGLFSGPVFGFWDQLYNTIGCCSVPSQLVPGVYDVINGFSTEDLFGAFWSPIEGATGSGIIPGPVVITKVPEPSTLILIVTGLLVLGFIARRNSPNHRRLHQRCNALLTPS